MPINWQHVCFLVIVIYCMLDAVCEFDKRLHSNEHVQRQQHQLCLQCDVGASCKITSVADPKTLLLCSAARPMAHQYPMLPATCAWMPDAGRCIATTGGPDGIALAQMWEQLHVCNGWQFPDAGQCTSRASLACQSPTYLVSVDTSGGMYTAHAWVRHRGIVLKSNITGVRSHPASCTGCS